MKYALSKGVTLRREWFGCLCYQAYTGHYRQFNEDAFEILRRLKRPITITELMNDLAANDMKIEKHALIDFLNHYKKLGFVSWRDEVSELLIFYEDKTDLRDSYLVVPSSVTLYITDFCPKQCLHCATNAHPNISIQDELTFDDWKKVIGKLREAGVLNLVVSGGEPLSVPYINELLKIIDELQFGLDLLTDYDDISEKEISVLKSLKHPIRIQTSLDGATPKSHDFLRGRGSFQRTMQRFKLLSNAGLDFIVAVAVHKKNIGELDMIFDLARSFGASYIYLNAIAPYGRAKKTMRELILNDDELKHIAQVQLRWASKGNIIPANPFWVEEQKHLGDSQYHPLENTLTAMSLGVYNFTINSKGDCFLDAKQRAEDFLCLGNILKTDLLEMWNDSRLDILRSICSQEKYTFAPELKIKARLGL